MSEWVEDEDGNQLYWPFCRIEACRNRACLKLESGYCWPHTKARPYEEMMSEVRNVAIEVLDND